MRAYTLNLKKNINSNCQYYISIISTMHSFRKKKNYARSIFCLYIFDRSRTCMRLKDRFLRSANKKDKPRHQMRVGKGITGY